MESTHGKLCTWFTDRLSSNDTYRFTNLYRLSCSHVCTVTFCTNTYMALTGKNCTDFHCIIWFAFCIYTLCYHSGSTFWCNHVICFYNDISVFIFDSLTGETSCNTFLKTFNLFFSIYKSFYPHTWNFAFAFTTVYFTYNQFLRYVYKTSCQVTGVSCTKSCIGQTFTRSMGGHEVFQYVQTFTEVRLNWQLNGVTGCIGHQTTHTCKLFNLLVRTTGSGVSHHVDVVVLIKTIQQRLSKGIVSLFPGIYNFFVTFFLCNETTFKVLSN